MPPTLQAAGLSGATPTMPVCPTKTAAGEPRCVHQRSRQDHRGDGCLRHGHRQVGRARYAVRTRPRRSRSRTICKSRDGAGATVWRPSAACSSPRATFAPGAAVMQEELRRAGAVQRGKVASAGRHRRLLQRRALPTPRRWPELPGQARSSRRKLRCVRRLPGRSSTCAERSARAGPENPSLRPPIGRKFRRGLHVPQVSRQAPRTADSQPMGTTSSATWGTCRARTARAFATGSNSWSVRVYWGKSASIQRPEDHRLPVGTSYAANGHRGCCGLPSGPGKPLGPRRIHGRESIATSSRRYGNIVATKRPSGGRRPSSYSATRPCAIWLATVRPRWTICDAFGASATRSSPTTAWICCTC